MIENKLTEIVNTILANRNRPTIKEVTADLTLRNDIGFDSLDLAELTVRVEAEFDIDIFKDGVINNVGQIIDQINQ